MKDRLDKGIEIAIKIAEECVQHEECERCPYDNRNECSASDVYTGMQYLSTIIPKESYIQLKNIDLSSVKPNEQMKKFNEEVEEFIIAVEEHNYMALKCKSHMIEEFWDVVQSGLGLLHFEGVEADEVMQGYGKHLLKMEQRGNKPREKGQK